MQLDQERRGDRDELVRDLARANADMAKVVTERFAQIIEAAAQLIRAADGAGIPAREPIAAPPRNATPTETKEEEESAEDDGNAQLAPPA